MPSKSWRRWLHLAASFWRRAQPALLGLLLGVPLLFIGMKLPTAGVSGFAETDFLRFKTASPFTTTHLRAVNLKMSGLASVETADSKVVIGDNGALSISTTVSGVQYTSIPSFGIGEGSQVTLTVDRVEKRLNLAIGAERLRFDLFPPQGSRVEIDGAACPGGTCDLVYEGPRPLSVRAGGDTSFELQMDLEVESRLLTDRVVVATVQLWEPELLPGTIERRGAIHEGSLRFLEAPEQAELLARGSVIDIEPTSLVLRAVEIRRDSVYIQFSGRVGEVSVVIGNARHSLMPTWFDRFSLDPRAQLALGILSILLGGGLTFIRSFTQGPPSEEHALEAQFSLEDPAEMLQAEELQPETLQNSESPPKELKPE